MGGRSNESESESLEYAMERKFFSMSVFSSRESWCILRCVSSKFNGHSLARNRAVSSVLRQALTRKEVSRENTWPHRHHEEALEILAIIMS